MFRIAVKIDIFKMSNVHFSSFTVSILRLFHRGNLTLLDCYSDQYETQILFSVRHFTSHVFKIMHLVSSMQFNIILFKYRIDNFSGNFVIKPLNSNGNKGHLSEISIFPSPGKWIVIIF